MRPMLKRPRLGGAVYVLPNLITTGNLFFGFVAIIESLKGDFTKAAMAILLAGIFDMLDGRVARMTKGTSEFGVQYDSLCDLVSFGLAPAFLAFQFGLNSFGRGGWMACFLFLACGALRLARFNVQSSVGKTSGDFTGLPIPMAAYVIACYVAYCADVTGDKGGRLEVFQLVWSFLSQEEVRRLVLIVMTPLLALLMVSNFAFRSHKSIKIKAVKPFRLLVLAVILVGLVVLQPELGGVILTAGYAISGPFEWIIGWKKAIDDDEIFEPLPDGDLIDTDVRNEDGEAYVEEANSNNGAGQNGHQV